MGIRPGAEEGEVRRNAESKPLPRPWEHDGFPAVPFGDRGRRSKRDIHFWHNPNEKKRPCMNMYEQL